MTKTKSLGDCIEKAAEQAVILDLDNELELKSFQSLLDKIAELFAIESETIASERNRALFQKASQKAAVLISGILSNDSKEPDNDYSLASEVICILQAAVCHDQEVVFPPELDLDIDTGAHGADGSLDPEIAETPENTGSNPSDTIAPLAEEALPNIMDGSLMQAYIEQQQNALTEIEQDILEFESDGNPEHVESIMRFLHTMKGEAGVCNIMEMEMLCHSFEDYIEHCRTVAAEASGDSQDLKGRMSIDLLLETKDWMVKAVESYKAGDQPGSVDEMVQKLEAEKNNPSQTMDDATTKSVGWTDTETESDDTSESETGSATSNDTTEPESNSATSNDTTEPETHSATSNDTTSTNENASGSVADVTFSTDAPPVSIPINDPELVQEFIPESQEHFDIADENLLILENEPDNKEAVAAVFRAFHTVKGVCSFLDLEPISELAHNAENLLDDVRKDKRPFAGAAVDLTFRSLDMLKLMINDLGTALAEGRDFQTRPEFPGFMIELEAVLKNIPLAAAQPGAAAAFAHPPQQQDQQSFQSETSVQASQAHTMESTGQAPIDPNGTATVTQQQAPPPPSQKHPPTPRELQPSQDDAKEATARAQKTGGMAVKQTMKVDADKVDLLLDTIGELVITESMVASDLEIRKLGSRNHTVEKNLSQLTKITRFLQDVGLSMRMVPIEGTFRKMARLARDLSHKSGKKTEFTMQGKETEIDKGMVENLGDPLIHMIRNSVDHGIEPTEDRIAAGKDPVGHINIKAFHKGGKIHIQIEDDGKGLDRDSIAKKAIERGLIQEKDVAAMSDQDVFSLIFEPGFSTAKQITEISGRGVGMDVVRRNIEKLRGKVLIESTLGQGTTFTIVLPLTMAIIDGMQARVGNQIYIIPTLSIVESFKPTSDMISSVMGQGVVIRFRDNNLPLFQLSDLFEVEPDITDFCEGIVIVVEEDGKQTALVVDELLGQYQTVIKSIGAGLGNIVGIAGASIMANGKPGLILDIGGVLQQATASLGEREIRNTSQMGMA